ncbi:MAG TPA: GNAT family N-acetyltransferase [Acidimicrobiales bacterium]|nr:GNAT family N-acetyltransferase [Acidimicrobiales bacterium]
MGVRTLGPEDVETLRSIRLRALADSPEQFSSTWEREALRTVEDWQRWIETGATFVFEDRGVVGGDGPDPVGLVAAVPDDDEPDPDRPGVVWLMAMWVEPAARGTGAAGALVDAVVGWARHHGATTVRLHVVEKNARARRLYERYGFRVTGSAECAGRMEIAMECAIGVVT